MSRVESWCGSGELPCNYGPDDPCDVCGLLAEVERLREEVERLQRELYEETRAPHGTLRYGTAVPEERG